MFEGVVAYALNKYLGRYVEDLDSEQLNVGIFSGTVHLTDLHLKPEALASLDLPIEVKGGCIGKISIDIPWTSLYYEPVLVHIEEILVLAGPTADRKYDPERDKRLSRAFKNRKLEEANPPDSEAAGDRPKGFMENLITTIVNNVQVSLQNVHIRYEDTVSTSEPLACGIVLQNLTAVTTNSRWKACQIDTDAKSLFKLLKVESLSVYWNPKCPTNTLVKAQLNSDGWKTLLRKGLATFSINGEDFDFIVKPVSLKTKMILNKSREAKVPKLLLDFVLQDAASQLSREQFMSMYELGRSFELMSMNQRFRKYFKSLSAKGNAEQFWRDAYSAVLEEYIRPYSWSRIKEHRNAYRKYKSMYKEYLHRPADSELKLDMQLLEDSLDVTSILAAREQAKIEIAEEEPELVHKVPTGKSWTLWNWFSSSGDEPDGLPSSPTSKSQAEIEELIVVGDRDRSWWTKMTAEERRRLFEGIGYERWGPEPQEPLNHIGHKLNFTLANCTLSLINEDKEILVATVTHFLSSLETRPGAKAYKISARTESIVIEGASIENDLVPIITADNVTSGDEPDFSPNSPKSKYIVETEKLVVGDRDKSWWTKMTAKERRCLFEGIGLERWGPEPQDPLNHIGHKLNFTLANCTLSLINEDKEILVTTVTHFLSSLETRPGAKAYKISARTESIVIEGASIENDLVPIITADNVTSGSNVPHVFALDFEKNPSHVNAKFGLTVSAEPMEIVYHKHAVKELLNFFDLPRVSVELLKQKAKQKLKLLAAAGKEKIEAAFAKHQMVHLNVDLRSPYFVIPEHGSLQQGGSVIVLDTGRFTVNTDLQSEISASEESTKMEAEERLYDRYNVALSDIQVLFSDSGEEWRAAKMTSESEMHLVPKAKVLVVFSNSVRPECKTLPRQKLNISVPSLKLNLSDRRVSMIVEFLQNIPLPKTPSVSQGLSASPSEFHLCSHTLREPSKDDLREVWKNLHRKRKHKSESPHQDENKLTTGALERSLSASDQSDEEEPGGAAEHWARVIDLPGFEDNVSASNYIRILFRLVAGEVAIHLARSSDHADKPYLMLRAEKLCIDAAQMQYGPALQASLHRIQLVDKLHKGSSGEYLELISSDNAADMITILYRKVQANCPEFKSHFHQVEHSLVMDFSTLSIAFHREAFMTLAKFLQYVAAKLKPRSPSFRLSGLPRASDLVFADSSDPPVPPGATKFSISARLNALRVRLCDTDIDLADLRVVGLETDYVLKANEKSVLRVNLTELTMEDLIEDTLYKKILATEGDKVFDIKWVRRSSHHREMIEARHKDTLPVRVDGSLRLRFGRTVIVLLHSFANELQRFMEPFLNPDATTFMKRSTEEKFQQKVSEFQQSGLRYQISVEIQAPTFLLPQKATSPNALVLQLGELSLENFFQEDHDHCIDNLLVRLHALQLARAVILLDGRMEIREPILEPLKLRLDIKRALKPFQNNGLLYQINGSMDQIKVNIGQRDLSTMIAIYQDNYARLQFLDNHKSMALSPENENGPEESVRKLEVFLYASTDVRKESSLTFIMEGLVLTLYADGEDLHSSSVRNPEQALTTFSLDEVSLSVEIMNDKALEMKMSCQAATLIDVRVPQTSSLRKIFQSYSGDCGGTTGVAGISLSMPPMVDLTYRRSASGDAALDAVVEKIRLNVSITYLLAVLKFVSDALPGSRLPSSSAFLEGEDSRRRLPSDCTSGYQSTISTDEMRAVSLSIVFRKPEVVLFAQPDQPDTGVLLLKMDVMLDYSFNLGEGNLMLSVAGLHVMSCVFGRRKHTMCTVLHPCELELHRCLRLAEEEIKMSVSMSSVQLCLSAPVIQTILQVSKELLSNLQEEEDRKIYKLEKEQKPMTDLWCPSSIHPQKSAEPECMCGYSQKRFFLSKYAESFSFNFPEVLIWCEIKGVTKNIPVLYAKAAFEAEVKDWSTQMSANGELKLEVMYYNEKVTSWEPLVEHVLIREGQYRPLEIMFKVFRDRAHPMVCNGTDEVDSKSRNLLATESVPSACSSVSSSGNETDEDDMITRTVIRRKTLTRTTRLSSIAKSRDSASFVACPGDSDSENEDGVLEKIASTFDHLFSDDEEGASDSPPSDSEGIADLDVHSDSGETETADNEDVFDDAAPVYSSPHRHHHHEHKSMDPAADMALYLTIDCRDTININVTPASVSVIHEVFQEFTSLEPKPKSNSSSSHDQNKEIELKNCLGPEATVKIMKKDEAGNYAVAEEVSGRGIKPPVVEPDLVTPLVDISPADSDSEMAGDENDGFRMSGIPMPLMAKQKIFSDNLYEEKSISQLYEESTKEKLLVEVEGFDNLICHLPERTTTTMYALQPLKNNTRYFVLVTTEMYHGQRTITVRSPLKIHNHLSKSVHVLCEKSVLESTGALPEDYSKNPFQDKFVRLTCLAPDDVYDLPLMVAYHCKLFFRPLPNEVEKKEYSLSTEGIWWKDMTAPQKSSKFLECYPENETENISCIKVVCEENCDLKTPSVGTKLVPNFSLHLYPPLVFHNLLPLALDIHLKNKSKTIRLQEGQSAVYSEFDPRQAQEILLEVGQYVGLQWHGKVTICGDAEEMHPVCMSPETDTGGGNRHLSLHVHLARDKSLDLYLFAPYWIINKTGLPLQFRGSMSDAVYEAASSADPLLFRFKKHRKKKAKLRVYSSHWSKSFSLDTVGNSGVVICADKERNKKYHVEMSKMLLTKVVVIKPFFLVINNTENHIRFMEKNENTDLWFDIAPDKCLPFWPDTDSLKMFVKLRDSKTVSQHFPIDFTHVTVLRMEHGSALKVTVTSGEDFPTTITFENYVPGDAPVRVDNYCEDLFLKIHQKSQSQVTLLNPYQSVLYTWDDPSQERTLIWNLYNRKRTGFPAHINRDGYGCEKVSFHSLRKRLMQQPSLRTSSVEESSSSEDDSESEDGLLPKKTRKDKVVVHWVSYVEKEQRVLLFTQDDRIAREVRKAVDGERAYLECFLSLSGIGLSLINEAHREIAYASLTSCPAIWEIEINRTWKLLTLELSAWLEDKWAADQHKAQLKDYLQVDLTKMQMIKPFFGQLRRFYSPAFWCQLRKSPYQTYAHFKIHRFQVDNQLPDAVFPTVLHPGTTPQYVVRRTGPKPFFDSALLLHSSKTSKTLKFWKVLLQEMHLNLDKGFLLSLQDMYSRFAQVPDEEKRLKEDLSIIQAPLYEQMPRRRTRKGVSFEYVHLSPIVIHFSFSPRGTVHRATPRVQSIQGDVVDLMLNSVGATLSEVKDIEIKLAFYERRGLFTRPRDLIADARSHYKSQLVQQIYVLVLGLDILGNPFGLLKDFTRGLGDFFYEPFLGSVKGPDEFAESLARGAQSLLGHVIGGSAGAISLVTGSLGQTLSVLTFDEDYRKKRQQRLQLRSSSLPETLCSATKSFVLSVGLGLSGVIVQPVTGGQLEGVEGFFRGIGKGLLGLITKPAGGVMDMVSMAFDGIRRAAEMGECVVLRMRLPRYINPTEGLRPYSPYMASGCYLLEQVSKGHYAETDIYWAHAALSPHDRTRVALLTDNHVFLLEKNRLWGGWNVDWVINVDDVLTVPHIQANNLVIKVKQEDWILNFAGDERFVQSDDPVVLEWLKDKVEKMLLYKMQDKPCPI